MRRTAVPGRIRVRRSKNCHSLRRQYSPHMEYKPGPAHRLKTRSMSSLPAHKQYCRRMVGTVRDNSVVCKTLALWPLTSRKRRQPWQRLAPVPLPRSRPERSWGALKVRCWEELWRSRWFASKSPPAHQVLRRLLRVVDQCKPPTGRRKHSTRPWSPPPTRCVACSAWRKSSRARDRRWETSARQQLSLKEA